MQNTFRSDSIYALNNKIMSNIINYGEVIYNEYEKIETFSYEEMNNIIKSLDLKNKTIYIIDKLDSKVDKDK